MAEKNRYAREVLVGIFLILAVWSIYLPVIWLSFTNYDDPSYVLENPPVLAGLNWVSIKWAFTHSHSGNWHPLTWLSHMLDCEVYDLRPVGHHLTNVFFHATNTLLLFGFLRSLTGMVWRSGVVAMMFAVHPLHVESVAWISERKDVVSAFFGILSLWAYAAYAKSKVQSPKSKVSEDASTFDGSGAEGFHALRYYALTLLLFALGLMSKPMLVTWPCVMLLLDFWPLSRFRPVDGKVGTQKAAVLFGEKLPFLVMSAVACIITIISQKTASAIATIGEVSLGPRISNAVLAYFRYIGKLVWPTRLSVIYLDTGQAPLGAALVALLVLAATTWVVWRLRNEKPYLLAGWAWYLGTLVPVIGLVKVGNQSMADRYTYLPAIGLFIMLVWGVADVIRARRWIISLVTTAMLTALTVVAQKQVMVWQNTETLFRHALKFDKDNFVALNSLGFYLADLGESDQASAFLHKSVAIQPNSAPAWNKLGSVLLNQGRYDEAISHSETALRLNPRLPEAHTTMALALIKQGKTNDAVTHYFDALRLNPDYSPANYNLANVLVHQGKFDEARKHYEAALRGDPRSADAHNNLAFLLARDQRLDEAISHFRSALRYKPSSWQAHYGLGEALARQSRFAEAAAEFQEVLRLQPKLAVGHFQLAMALARLGKVSDAVASAEQARIFAVQTGQQDLAQKSQQLQERLKTQ